MLVPGTIWSMKRFILSMVLVLVTTLGLSGVASLSTSSAYACTDVTLGSPIDSSTSVKCSGGGLIFNYLVIIIQFLSGAIGLVIVLMIVIGGVQYITSAGDPGAVKAAKQRIVNAITGLVLFLLMFAILNFLIPGGILT
jgi:hypothetical protein